MRNRAGVERQAAEKEADKLNEKIVTIEDEKNQNTWKFQKEIVLLNERLKFA